MNGTSLNSKMAGLLVCLLLFDMVTKLSAYYDLPRKHSSFYIPHVGAIYPEYNPISLDTENSTLTRLFIKHPTPNITGDLLVASLMLIVMVFKRIRMRPWLKWVAGFLLCVASGRLARMAGAYDLPQFEHGPVVVWSRFMAVFSMILLCQYAQTGYTKTCYIVLAAGTFGNILSYFYPPYHPIDFIRPAQLHFVFNIADFYIVLGLALLLLSPVYFPARGLAGWMRGTKPPPAVVGRNLRMGADEGV